MLNTTLFTSFQFDNEEKSKEFFEFLNQAGEEFIPTRFDSKEPVRKIYNPSDLTEPIRLLCGFHKKIGGGILLKGKKYNYLSLFRWHKSKISDWYIDISAKFFNSAGRIEEFIQFIIMLCTKFQVIYGGAAPKDDWNAKHLLIRHNSHGDSIEEMVGISIERCLPGIYWFTILSEVMVEHFGRPKIESLPVHRIIDLDKGGVALILRELPFLPEQSDRLRHDKEIMNILGNEYFFDINNLEKECRKISGFTQGGVAVPKELVESKFKTEIELDYDFENQLVLSPDGIPYSNPKDLGEMLVVYLHTKVKEIFFYSKSALSALDSYFAKHPQKFEYTSDHLKKEFIPALGAYLGEVIVRELNGKWKIREPILKSTILIQDKEIFPFQAAFRVIYQDIKLIDLYTNLKKSIKES